jgi:hypothetical protein
MMAACLAVCLTGPLAAADATSEEASAISPVERSALRAIARDRINAMIHDKAVRPVDAAAAAEESRNIARRLSDEQLRAIAEGEEVQQTIAPSLRNVSAAALGNSTSELLFVPLPPCRIIDTRKSQGPIAAGETRSFQVAGVTEFGPQGGTIGGCGVPPGSAEPVAAAVMLNIVAVDVAGKGNLQAWAYGQPVPLATSINFQRVDMNIANGLIVPIAGTNLVPADLNVKANFSAAQLVIDVTGYFTRFPIEQFESSEKSITVVAEGGAIDLGTGACTEVSSCTITAAAPGKVIVRTWSQIQLDHGTNVGGDRIAVGVKNADPTNCTNNDQSINATDYELPDSLPAESDIDWTLSHKRIFSQGTGTKTYYINARMITGASSGDRIQTSRMICTFIPD